MKAAALHWGRCGFCICMPVWRHVHDFFLLHEKGQLIRYIGSGIMPEIFDALGGRIKKIVFFC